MGRRPSAAPTRPASSSTAATGRSRSSRCGCSARASHPRADRRVVREDGGYPMGPFELMDLIGIDVNYNVARSFYAQRPEPRWEPHPIQERMVAEGRLGRKTGAGLLRIRGRKRVERRRRRGLRRLRRAVLDRVGASSSTRAASPPARGSPSPGDIDAAMRLGLNHPRGPFEWLDELGAERVLATLDALGNELGPDRYRPAPRLRRPRRPARAGAAGCAPRRPGTSRAGSAPARRAWRR